MLDSIFKEYYEINVVNTILDCPGKGGNISVKNSEFIVIKASGEDLKQSTHNISVVDMITNLYDIKPSMEIGMHLAIPYKYVVHYHPIYVMPFLVSDREFAKESISIKLDHCEVDWSYVNYFEPGKSLASAIESVFETKKPKIIFLQNHGVVISSDDKDEIKKLYELIKEKFMSSIFIDNCYSPDDVAMKTNPEQILYKMALLYLCEANKITPNELSTKEITSLLNNEDEKFRMAKTKEKK